ncbi:unnamed protein product [Miscanthus lutarioriparius]|uniref:SIAH-type domain-containing protein n=1 Tax=Miscanthus lutarioriparius TaxID=422564 RepID=A0A811SEB8_9POAL|nr:unnamed protein product [Miscanthus lutarioriparius]
MAPPPASPWSLRSWTAPSALGPYSLRFFSVLWDISYVHPAVASSKNLRNATTAPVKASTTAAMGLKKIIESIQVPCSNTKYGCSMKTSYYERAGHETKCRYAPCFCPDSGCSFSASTGLLQEHFSTEHHWPFTKCKYGWCFYADVKEGVHVISSEDEQLFLRIIASEPFGCVISVFCVQPHDTEPKSRCAVTFSFWKNNSYHSQSSEFQAPSTTLSDSIPRDRFLFILPRFYIDEDSRICVTMKKDSGFQHEKTDTLGADCYSSLFSPKGK